MKMNLNIQSLRNDELHEGRYEKQRKVRVMTKTSTVLTGEERRMEKASLEDDPPWCEYQWMMIIMNMCYHTCIITIA
jgi:hypothetical protein